MVRIVANNENSLSNGVAKEIVLHANNINSLSSYLAKYDYSNHSSGPSRLLNLETLPVLYQVAS